MRSCATGCESIKTSMRLPLNARNSHRCAMPSRVGVVSVGLLALAAFTPAFGSVVVIAPSTEISTGTGFTSPAGRSTAVASESAFASAAILGAPGSPETDPAPDVSALPVAVDSSAGCSVLAHPTSARAMQHVGIRGDRMIGDDTSAMAATIFLPRRTPWTNRTTALRPAPPPLRQCSSH